MSTKKNLHWNIERLLLDLRHIKREFALVWDSEYSRGRGLESLARQYMEEKIDDAFARHRDYDVKPRVFYNCNYDNKPMLMKPYRQSLEMRTKSDIYVVASLYSPTTYTCVAKNIRVRVEDVGPPVVLHHEKKLYVIYSKSLGLYKIGYSQNPSGRMKDLKKDYGEDLVLVCFYAGIPPHEKMVHFMFNHKKQKPFPGEKVCGDTEWFKLTKNDLTILKNLLEYISTTFVYCEESLLP